MFVCVPTAFNFRLQGWMRTEYEVTYELSYTNDKLYSTQSRKDPLVYKIVLPVYCGLLNCITYFRYPTWRSIGRSPLFFIEHCPGQYFPVVIHSFDICFQFPVQCILWSSSFLSPFRILSRGLPHDVVSWFSQYMSYPIPRSFPNFPFSRELVCSLP